MEQRYKWKKLELGVCYYPEHWSESLWESDLERMRECGICTIRIGEFAWTMMEPEEGEYDFSFFKRFLDLASKLDMKVIFGTPTAAPPVWLTMKYPEVLNCNIQGIPYSHGARRHYNYNSPVYQTLCKRIVEKLGENIGNHPAIIGWQIDNELNCETDEFYSESDSIAFRKFLKARYGSLEALNEAWGTVFWNQIYTQWEQVFVPRQTIYNAKNPHQVLDYKRFISESAILFCKIQCDALREFIPEGVFITTNGILLTLDSHQLMDECLDVFSFDSYPNFEYCLSEDPKNAIDLIDRKWTNKLAMTRAICPHFAIMEQQVGAHGSSMRMESPAPKPGQMMLWAMQSIAHGADFISFFRWRTCPMGSEIYWHGILDYDNRDNRKVQEIKKLAERIHKIEDIANTKFAAEIGYVKDYDNVLDCDVDSWHSRFDKPSMREISVASQLAHAPLDYIYLWDKVSLEELTKYKVLFYPHAMILTKERVELLTQYVEQGGVLILGCRTGLKDETGKFPMMQAPGLLRELAGVGVTDYTFVGPYDETVTAEWNGTKMNMPVFNDILEIQKQDVKVLARYCNNYYSGETAMTEREVKLGKIIYVASTFEREMVTMLLQYIEVNEPYGLYINLPEECELVVREKDGVKYFIVLNYAHHESIIQLRENMIDCDTGEVTIGEIVLKEFETKVYRLLLK